MRRSQLVGIQSQLLNCKLHPGMLPLLLYVHFQMHTKGTLSCVYHTVISFAG